MALETLHEDVKPLGLQVSWTKTKVQMFGVLLDKQYSLFMGVARTLISWTASNTLVAWSICDVKYYSLYDKPNHKKTNLTNLSNLT